MKIKLIFSLALMLILAIAVHAQNVGIASTIITPDASSMLEVQSATKGLLIPRVALTLTTAASPVTAPATSLLVYNTATVSDVTPGYYYWNGSKWVRLLSGAVCNTLDEAYDCGGSGIGRTITSDAGAVYISVPVGSTSTEGLNVNVTKVGTALIPIAGVSATHTTAQGVALVGEVTNAGNYYAGVQGFNSATNSTGGIYPSGVSGYFDGSGIGVGVWGETTASGLGAGVYGNGQGTLNFGGVFYSAKAPGIDIKNGTASWSTAQITSFGASYINPALTLIGKSQFDCSTNANVHSVMINNLGTEPTVAPSGGGYGYVGTAGVYWYYVYSDNLINVSQRELKRNIQSFDKNMYVFAIDEIMKMKPSLYKFKNENDEVIAGQELKTRYNYHMGLVLDEAPDFLQDNTFGGIDAYALSTLNLAGIQYLNNEVENINSWAPVSDFGQGSIAGTEIRVNYTEVITENEIEGTPVVSITPTSAGARYYVKSQDESGFVLVSENGAMTFNWVANTRKAVVERKYDIPESTMSQLRVNQAKKDVMIGFGRNQQDVPMQFLDGGDPGKNQTLRMKPSEHNK